MKMKWWIYVFHLFEPRIRWNKCKEGRSSVLKTRLMQLSFRRCVFNCDDLHSAVQICEIHICIILNSVWSLFCETLRNNIYDDNSPRCSAAVLNSFWITRRKFCNNSFFNWPLPSSKNPHFQNEAKCTTFLVKTRMKNRFHFKGWALNLVLIQRPRGTWKWLIYGQTMSWRPQYRPNLQCIGWNG